MNKLDKHGASPTRRGSFVKKHSPGRAHSAEKAHEFDPYAVLPTHKAKGVQQPPAGAYASLAFPTPKLIDSLPLEHRIKEWGRLLHGKGGKSAKPKTAKPKTAKPNTAKPNSGNKTTSKKC